MLRATPRGTSRPGGRFVIELWMPGIRRFPPGQAAVPFHLGDQHVGFDTYDMATQQGDVAPLLAIRTTARSSTASATSATSGRPSAT